uniref:Peptidase S1 domain-containing protein n=1 Tax=Otolemur garnettii TaxID=30611 RepID=H0WX91_OTOGA
ILILYFCPTLSLGNAILPLGALDNLTESLIVHGEKCRPHSQPWQVAIFRSDDSFNCGGVLVHPQWVLSAAHCYQSSYTIKLGRHNLYANYKPGRRTMMANFSVKHPRYTEKPKRNDIMLIKLKEPVRESASIRTITMASQCTAPGTTCVTSGWAGPGRVETCQPQCTWPAPYLLSYGHHRNSLLYTPRKRINGETRKQPPKKGDSGGPLICGGLLQGILSTGRIPCVPYRKPCRYTKVCDFYEWIRHIIEAN